VAAQALSPDGYGAALPSGSAAAALRIMFPEPQPYLDSPAVWVEERLGEFIWSKQEEICQSVVENQYTAVKACHGPGKSFIAARIALWWLDVHELGDAFVITTAPSWPQVQAILWREMRRAHRRGRLPGRITLDCQMYMGEGNRNEELIAMGRKPADYDDTAFQGLHARFILILFDEACGIPEQLWVAALTLMTNDNARFLAIGNPDDPGSRFAHYCKHGSGWNVIKIAAYDTPNFTGEPVPERVAEELVSQHWVEDRTRDWGEGSPLWTSKIMAEFPDVSDEYLITPKMIETGINTDLPGFDSGRYGIDVARMGQDKSVVYRNRGGRIRFVQAWGHTDTMQSTGKIKNILDNNHLSINMPPSVIDVVGLGAGPFDRLREQGYPVVPFSGGERAYRPDKFKNRRAEAYWQFRMDLEAGLVDLDPKDEILHKQLQTVKWFVDSTGRIQMESKDDMRARGVDSPDFADAAIMSCQGRPPFVQMNLEGSLAADLLDKAM
jgi:hypothetical protein